MNNIEKLADKHLERIIPESYNRTTGRIAIMIEAMEQYHQSQLQALKEEVEKERFALLDLNKSRATGRNSEFEKGIDRGLEIALNLIINLEDK